MILRNIKASVVAKVLDISEFSTDFNTVRFLRIFVYHIIFWYVGPLVVPLVWLFDSYTLNLNMAFWFGTNEKFALFIQYM